MPRSSIARLAALAALGLFVVTPAAGQVRTVDPDVAAAQSDLAPVPGNEAGYGTQMPVDTPSPSDAPTAAGAPAGGAPAAGGPGANAVTATGCVPPATPASGYSTYSQEDVIGAAEGVFGKGAEGLAKMIRDLLKKQGDPNGYIVGREAGGAFIVGLRYGSGILHHKVEGDCPVHWTGPSLGFDVGANGAKTFVLVYNLYDTEDLYKRYPSAEGDVYVVGGFTASYLRRGDIVLIPIRLGVGWRLGANVGYMKFTHKSKILPF